MWHFWATWCMNDWDYNSVCTLGKNHSDRPRRFLFSWMSHVNVSNTKQQNPSALQQAHSKDGRFRYTHMYTCTVRACAHVLIPAPWLFSIFKLAWSKKQIVMPNKTTYLKSKKSMIKRRLRMRKSPLVNTGILFKTCFGKLALSSLKFYIRFVPCGDMKLDKTTWVGQSDFSCLVHLLTNYVASIYYLGLIPIFYINDISL